MHIQDAAVILHLRFRLKPGARQAFFDYFHEARPIFEAGCDCRGVVYAEAGDEEMLDEVFYYRTETDYKAGERLIEEDPAQRALVARWRELLDGPPQVTVQRRIAPLP